MRCHKSEPENFCGRYWVEVEIIEYRKPPRWEFFAGLTKHEADQKAIERINELMADAPDAPTAPTASTKV